MECSFLPSSVYCTKDPITSYSVYALVIEVHSSGRAVFVLIYDHTWGYISLRWCRVLGSSFYAGRYSFDALKIVKDSACIPPEDVLNFLASRA